MYHRDPRSFAHDDQNNAYPTGHVSHTSGDYSATGYQQQEQQPGGSDHYYEAPPHPMTVANPASPYFRSMTPSLVPANRYLNSSRDPRYYNSQAFGGSSSSSSPSPYPAQSPQYASHYLPPSDHRSGSVDHTPQFIPTPSEIASSYSSYSHQMTSPQSPTIPEDGFPPDYPVPPHMVPPSLGGGHRSSRIATGRPRTVSTVTSTSSASASSATGERFPCEKCGKTFSRSHDRKRHHETQHLATPIYHVCPYCSKEFSRYAIDF
ncbi:hypothetical protein CPB84DRAFT_1678420 [Gymnopilus junonius]|uniref:C2H2-type domain-containing protein n=1 Tax=Gymnopilus junonius TaxID=109634 RepID=A0A9P5NRJ7_GYMJU|nr:hypothetical protein CPB84DRAFT_1678420 [Gymnopilus junonius]